MKLTRHYTQQEYLVLARRISQSLQMKIYQNLSGLEQEFEMKVARVANISTYAAFHLLEQVYYLSTRKNVKVADDASALLINLLSAQDDLFSTTAEPYLSDTLLSHIKLCIRSVSATKKEVVAFLKNNTTSVKFTVTSRCATGYSSKQLKDDKKPNEV